MQAWPRPGLSKTLRLQSFLDSRYIKVVRFSALSTGRLNPPRPPPHQEIFLVLISVVAGIV